MFEFFLPIVFYFVIVIFLKNSSKKGQKKSWTEFIDTIKEYFEVPEGSQEIVEEKKEAPISVFEESVPTETFDQPVFTHDSWELFEDDDDVILEVERIDRKTNIKDVRSKISKRSIRQGIIVSEILNKPKSLR